ncbi:MFS transporter [Sphaerisporangium sp. B11E5]|uniref:MFS transporter n=1 Tax=Sphaerisporangium sp. B11E5 TaxID=3153563 RepID=UPI00325D9858
MNSDGGRMTSKQAWVLGLAALASFMMALDSSVVTTALTTIKHDLAASVEELEWTVNAYNLPFAVLLLTGAALGDRFGRRRVFVAGLALFTAASAACALSPGIGALIAARAAQGAGAAMVLPLSLTLISAAFPPRQRGRAMGLYLGITGLATLGGPFIGGVIAEGLAWQWIFWLNLPFGVITILLTMRRVGESHGPDTRLDLGGVVLVTSGAFGVVWGLVRRNAAGWGSAEVVGALVLGVTLLTAFVLWERRAKAPMLPMRFFRLRAFATANPANFCVFASLYGTLFFLAQYFQTVLGEGPLGAGLLLMPWTATLMLCAPIAGALADRYGERTFVAGGLALQTLGTGWIAVVAGTGAGYPALLPALILSGVGLTMAMPAAQRAVVGAVRPHEIGQASGAFMMLRIFGGVFGVAVSVAVFASAGGYASAEEFNEGFTAAMAAVATLAFIGMLTALGMPRRRPAAVAAPPRGDEPKEESHMTSTSIIRYTTKPDAADENQRVVEKVFAELAEKAPAGLRYATFRLADGVTFVHIVQKEEGDDTLTELAAFKEFGDGFKDRAASGPERQGATLVGSYNFMS